MLILILILLEIKLISLRELKNQYFIIYLLNTLVFIKKFSFELIILVGIEINIKENKIFYILNKINGIAISKINDES